ncbi:MAG: hypothetical protein AB1941_00700 [Gemmatimonadota bacterium]
MAGKSSFVQVRTVAMESVRLGRYTRIGRALTEIVDRNLDLRTCTEEDLAAVHGCS